MITRTSGLARPAPGARSRRLVGAASAALLAAAFAGAALPATARAQDDGFGLPVGTAAPDAQVQDLDGNPVSLLEVAGGGPALIEFWASWCEQCELLQPQLDEIRKRFAGRVAVVAVAVAVNQSPRRVRRHLERHDPGYPYVYDADGEAVRAYKALTTSIVVLIDGDGKIVSTGVGPDQELVAAVEKLVGAEER